MTKMTDEQIEKAAQHFADELRHPASVPGILIPLIVDIAKDSYIHGAREALASQWISVKEALPENDDHVIVFAPADSVYPAITTARTGVRTTASTSTRPTGSLSHS